MKKHTVVYDIVYTNKKGVTTYKLGLTITDVQSYKNTYNDVQVIDSYITSEDDYNSIEKKHKDY